MRSKEWQRGAFVVIALGVAGCGSGNPGSVDGGSTGGFDVDKLLRACTVLHSCFVGFDYDDISGCVSDFKWYGTPTQVDCVLAASVANCTAA